MWPLFSNCTKCGGPHSTERCPDPDVAPGNREAMEFERSRGYFDKPKEVKKLKTHTHEIEFGDMKAHPNYNKQLTDILDGK